MTRAILSRCEISVQIFGFCRMGWRPVRRLALANPVSPFRTVPAGGAFCKAASLRFCVWKRWVFHTRENFERVLVE
jgi:hypothetical protein